MPKARYPFGYWRDIRRTHAELGQNGIDASPPRDGTRRDWQDFRQSWDAWLYRSPGQEGVPPAVVIAHWAGSAAVRDHQLVDAGVLTIDTVVGSLEVDGPPTKVTAQRQIFYYVHARLRGPI